MSKTIKELYDAFEVNSNRINEIADKCEKEQRGRTEAEEAEYRSLSANNEVLKMRMQTLSVEKIADVKENGKSLDSIVRENVNSGKPTEITLSRSSDPTGGMGGSGAKLNMVADVTDSGLIPVTQKAITEAIEEGTIYSQLPNLKIESGLVGDQVYPVVESVAATVLGEGVKLGDTELDLSSITAKPERIGVAVPITREAINKTNGVVQSIATGLLPKAVAKLVNKIMFSTTKVTGATNLVGPFQPIASTFRKLGTAPAFADMNALKADLLKEGVMGDNIAFVMSPTTYALLEVTPKDQGSGLMVIENNKCCGVPVYVTSEIGDSFVGIGDFSYCTLGFHGDMNLIVDLYSRARANSVDIVLNALCSVTVTQAKAFKLGKLVAKA